MNYFWFRRDLRITDNAGLYKALKHGKNVQCIFIFDRNILDHLEHDDARVSFIYNTLTEIKESLNALGSDLRVEYGTPLEVWRRLAQEAPIDAVYTNSDYEPYALTRDAEVAKELSKMNIPFMSYKDHVVFEKDEVTKDDGLPYTVFTPYKRKWLAKLESKIDNSISYYFKSYPCDKYYQNFKQTSASKMISLRDMNFIQSNISIPEKEVAQGIIKLYDKQRDYPAIKGTSMLGIHFRFGTISIREKARKAQRLNDTFLSELVWRDFYSQIIFHFPHVVQNAFREKYDAIKWRFDEQEYQKWTKGLTGYPLVDAGMRELNATGYMHNRVRMVVASFFTKHMLHDWRLGEAYFAQKLLDFDLASNNGGWQWASGSGTDAAPYFRIFNPTSQLTKFDKSLVYVKKWIPEYGTSAYPEPMVDHKEARERCLSAYKSGLEGF